MLWPLLEAQQGNGFIWCSICKKSNVQEVEAECGYKGGGLTLIQVCLVCVRKARTHLQLMLEKSKMFLKVVCMWHLGTRFSDELGSAAGMVGLDNPGILNDSMILYSCALASAISEEQRGLSHPGTSAVAERGVRDYLQIHGLHWVLRGGWCQSKATLKTMEMIGKW